LQWKAGNSSLKNNKNTIRRRQIAPYKKRKQILAIKVIVTKNPD
jgi:hypothetical protein